MLLPHLLPFAHLAPRNTIIECFAPSLHSQSPLHPINVAACIETATLLHGDKWKAPMMFSRSPTVGFQVPHEFSGLNSCNINIDVRSEGDEVMMTLSEVARIAVGIASVCSNQPQLGGRTWVPDEGEAAGKFMILVHGVEWPAGGVGPGNGTGAVAGSNEVVDGEGAKLRLGVVGNGTGVGTARRWEGGVEGGPER